MTYTGNSTNHYFLDTKMSESSKIYLWSMSTIVQTNPNQEQRNWGRINRCVLDRKWRIRNSMWLARPVMLLEPYQFQNKYQYCTLCAFNALSKPLSNKHAFHASFGYHFRCLLVSYWVYRTDSPRLCLLLTLYWGFNL